MREEQLGGWALIIGAAIGLVTMAFHPNVAVHALAMLAVPVALFGAMAIALWSPSA